MDHDGVCCLSSDEFVKDDVSALISYLSDCQLSDFYFVFFSVYLYIVHFILCVSRVRFIIINSVGYVCYRIRR